MIQPTIQVNDIIEVTIPFSSERYKTTCIYIDSTDIDNVVVYGADGTRCKIWDVVGTESNAE